MLVMQEVSLPVQVKVAHLCLGVWEGFLGQCVDLGLMFDWKGIVMENVVDNVQFVFVFFLLQVVGVEPVVQEFYCRVFVLWGGQKCMG